MSHATKLFPVLLALLSYLLAPSLPAQENDQEKVDFAHQILPLLSEKCFVCHGPDAKSESELRLDSFAGATADLGGYQAIAPSSLADSEILVRINSTDAPMPPEESAKKLTEEQRALISRWVHQGGQYTTHWAYVPPKKQLPANFDSTGDAHAIDAHVLQRLRSQNMDFAAEADAATLARRAALVLTGLPPEPEQLKRFLNNKSSDAYAQLVEELLASPRFGEHQARYWLDVVRYGDTHGLHLDNRRGIHPYRDWVVKAFNENLPLSDFITWQLAGDLLPEPRLEQLVATGFVRLNPTTAEGGVIPAEFQAKNSFDRTETFGTAFLGLSLTCARCHTHKYDPISQTEYYRLFAFFNNTAEAALDGNSYTYEPVVKAPDNYDAWLQWEALEDAHAKLLDSAKQNLDETNLSQAEVERWQSGSKQDRIATLADPQGPFASLDLHLYARVVQNGIQNAEEKFTTTLVAKDLNTPRETRLLERGEYTLPIGDPLEPGTISVLGDLPDDAPRNRLGLAQWLMSPQHPLTSRVLINRIWQRTFGNGLVRTPEDFGVQGQQSTHPELLDWLAVELMESGWDLKHMIRLMVNSRTFKQSSAWRSEIDDPENKLLSRGPAYRLDAEVLRDLGLWASQLLDPTMGGEGVKPYQPPGMWLAMAHPASNTKNYVRDHGQRLYRKSLYVYWKRTSPHPMMTLFDAPSRESSCVRRAPTNTSLQSLALLNETQRIEMSRMLAERLIRDGEDDWARFELLFRMLACRGPTKSEQSTFSELLATMRERYGQDKTAAEELLATGDAVRNDKLDAAEHAAWTQVAATFLASDVAISLY